MMNKPSTSPSTILFFSTLLSSTLLVISSSNWLLLWIFMELNLMSMIPLITSTRKSSEASTKYFIIQSVASMVMITMIISFPVASQPASWLITASLLLKMGMAPFHFWLPQVISNLQWPTIFILTTWQKISPLIILSSIMHSWSPNLLTPLIFLNAMVGASGGINQSQIRPLIAYSSIAHSAWLITCFMLSPLLTQGYFILYCALNGLVILPLYSTMKTSTTIFTFSNSPKMFAPSWALNFLSLGGMPPLLGFFPKWVVILSISMISMPIAGILILSSMISLFFYLTIFLSALLTKPNKKLSMPTPTAALVIPLLTVPLFMIMPLA